MPSFVRVRVGGHIWPEEISGTYAIRQIVSSEGTFREMPLFTIRCRCTRFQSNVLWERTCAVSKGLCKPVNQIRESLSLIHLTNFPNNN